MPDPIRLAVLASGGGSTLQNLIDRIAAGRLAAAIALVIAGRPEIGAADRARAAGLPVEVIDARGFADVDAFSDRVFGAVRAADASLVCLAGWLRLLRVPPDFAGRVLNIHPALLPAFGGRGMYGRRVHEAVIAHGCRLSGCTVHVVDDAYDNGPIILQRACPVAPDDTPESLARRVFCLECDAYPEAIELFRAGRLRVEGRRVVIAPA